MNVMEDKKYIWALFSLLTIFLLGYVGFADSKLCNTEKDCERNECCVALSIFDLPTNGICVELSMEGQYCQDRQAKLKYYGGMYILQCPCQEGLACLLEENISYRSNDEENPSYLYQRCHSVKSVTFNKITDKMIKPQNGESDGDHPIFPSKIDKHLETVNNTSSTHPSLIDGIEDKKSMNKEARNIESMVVEDLKGFFDNSSEDEEIKESTSYVFSITESTTDALDTEKLSTDATIIQPQIGELDGDHPISQSEIDEHLETVNNTSSSHPSPIDGIEDKESLNKEARHIVTTVAEYIKVNIDNVSKHEGIKESTSYVFDITESTTVVLDMEELTTDTIYTEKSTTDANYTKVSITEIFETEYSSTDVMYTEESTTETFETEYSSTNAFGMEESAIKGFDTEESKTYKNSSKMNTENEHFKKINEGLFRNESNDDAIKESTTEKIEINTHLQKKEEFDEKLNQEIGRDDTSNEDLFRNESIGDAIKESSTEKIEINTHLQKEEEFDEKLNQEIVRDDSSNDE